MPPRSSFVKHALKIATLNIRHGGGRRNSAISEYLSTICAEVLVLSEFRNTSNGAALLKSLHEQGYAFTAHHETDHKQNSVLIASKYAFEQIPLSDGLGEHHHRLLAVRAQGIDIVGCYFPQSYAKAPVFQYMTDVLRGQLSQRSLIIGDMNTGSHLLDELGKTFHCSSEFETLIKDGWVDAWRSRNPTGKEFSWYSSYGNGFRIDHAFTSAELDTCLADVSYDHSPRLSKVTDCVFHGNLPLSPAETCHQFHAKPATHSMANQPPLSTVAR
jgi:exonuclease III